MIDNAKNLLKKYGRCERMQQGRIPALYSVICQGCGKKITTNCDGEIGYIITKRRSVIFWHKECEDRIGENRSCGRRNK